jgi:hypothetical protein
MMMIHAAESGVFQLEQQRDFFLLARMLITSVFLARVDFPTSLREKESEREMAAMSHDTQTQACVCFFHENSAGQGRDLISREF